MEKAVYSLCAEPLRRICWLSAALREQMSLTKPCYFAFKFLLIDVYSQSRQLNRLSKELQGLKNKEQKKVFGGILCYMYLCVWPRLYQLLHNRLHFPLLHAVNFEKKLCSFAMIVCPVWWGCECVREDRVRREGHFRQCGCVCVCREGSPGEGGPVLFDHARWHGHLGLSIECRIVRQHCEHSIQIKRSVYLSAIFILLLSANTI